MTSLLIKLYGRLCSVIPVFRKISRKLMYETMSLVLKQDHWVFMNYGFAPLNGSDSKPVLDSSDERHRLSYQLYDHLTTGIDLKNKSVLEIGCGRGGGASMIAKYQKPEKMIGLDFSSHAIKFCNKNLSGKGLSFIKGDAERLPFDLNSFDAIINVESSHCYGSMNRFLAEVNKVLRPGGHFLFADFRNSEAMDVLEKQLHDSGMKVLKKRDITHNVLQALDEDHERRMNLISRDVPKPFKKQFREFAGVKDSVVYKRFKSGNFVYFSYILQRI
jgi:ubiquinone/menaquinone biosynthesis C-methylase UbiE